MWLGSALMNGSSGHQRTSTCDRDLQVWTGPACVNETTTCERHKHVERNIELWMDPPRMNGTSRMNGICTYKTLRFTSPIPSSPAHSHPHLTPLSPYPTRRPTPLCTHIHLHHTQPHPATTLPKYQSNPLLSHLIQPHPPYLNAPRTHITTIPLVPTYPTAHAPLGPVHPRYLTQTPIQLYLSKPRPTQLGISTNSVPRNLTRPSTTFAVLPTLSLHKTPHPIPPHPLLHPNPSYLRHHCHST